MKIDKIELLLNDLIIPNTTYNGDKNKAYEIANSSIYRTQIYELVYMKDYITGDPLTPKEYQEVLNETLDTNEVMLNYITFIKIKQGSDYNFLDHVIKPLQIQIKAYNLTEAYKHGLTISKDSRGYLEGSVLL